MRVLFVVDSLSNGGAGRVVSILANKLQNSNNDISVCIFNSKNIEYQLLGNIEIIKGYQAKRFLGNLFLGRVLFLTKHIKKNKYDIIISFLTELNIITIISSMFQKAKVIVSERNDPKMSNYSTMVRFFRKIFYRFADGYVFQTDEIKKFFNKKIQSRSEIIPNPLNENIPTPVFKNRKKKIIMAGRLTSQKNYPLAILSFKEICKKYSDYTLEIYGTGSKEKELLEIIKNNDLKGKVFLKGQCKNIYDEMNKSSVFLMTSDYEGMPNALMEAMSLGLICIATDCSGGGARFLINNNENGLLVPVNNSTILINTIESVLENIENYYKLGIKAKDIRKEFSVEIIEKKWDNYIKRIMGDRNVKRNRN